MNKVYAIKYGDADTSQEVVQQLYHDPLVAADVIEQCAREVFDDDPTMTDEGYIYEMIADSNRDPLCIITLRGEEIMWWRVVPMKVY